MLNIRLVLRRTARKLGRGGFTLVELLVVIGIIAILAGVALGPITSGIEKAKESSGLQITRSINLLMFSAANDNNQTYLTGTTSESICNQLLNQKYANDPTIFAITGTKYSSSSSGGAYTLSSGNVDFDFSAQSTSSGITSSTTDQMPIVYTTGTSGATFSASSSATLNTTLAPKPPFGLNGMAVAYKSNSAVFLKGSISSSTTAVVNNFISANYSDSGSYTQIRP